MTKLAIKPIDPNHEGMMGPEHVIVTLDGVPIKITELTLHLEQGCASEVAIAFRPESISIEASLLASLAAAVKLTEAGDENETDKAVAAAASDNSRAN